jgi:transcriptional regulator with GAF, ATPase, and Fis domain
MIHSRGNTLVVDDDLRDSGVESPPDDGGSTLDDAQRKHIEGVLDRCQWRINGAGNAAERLGLHPNTLRFRMKKLGLTRPDAVSTAP